MGDFKMEDCPDLKDKKFMVMAKRKIADQTKKIKTLQQTVRRWKSRADNLKNLIQVLKNRLKEKKSNH